MKDEVVKFDGKVSYKTKSGFASKASFSSADCMVWDLLHLLDDADLRRVEDAIAAQRKLRALGERTLEEVGP